MKFPFPPRYFLASVLLLSILVALFAVSRALSTQHELSRQLEEKGLALADALETSSRNAILSNALMEEMIAQRLLDNARLVDQLLLFRPPSPEWLRRIGAMNRLVRVDLLDRDGRPYALPTRPPGMMGMMGMSRTPEEMPEAHRAMMMYMWGRRWASPPAEGEVPPAIRDRKFWEGSVFGVAVGARSFPGIIAIHADADYVLNFSKEIGVQRQVEELGRQAGIESIALLDQELTVVAHSNSGRLGQRETDEGLREALKSRRTLTRLVRGDGSIPIYEVVKPLALEGSQTGLLRIGLSTASMDRVWRRDRLQAIILGLAVQMQEVLSLVRRVAPSDATVLIRGESGTGKELIAKAIHYASPRAAGPLVKVNCAALPETLLESELFGHEKGAFTGAVSARKGRFELADGGSLFLDEIGDLPLHLQVKLLRVLQEREFERVGTSRPTAVNVRVLAATHRTLEALVRDGRFRDDLYYRINVVTITLPPLRERREDLPLLIDHFVRAFATKNGKPIRGLTGEAREVLLRYDYPGNVRELENLIERAVVLTRNEVIGLADLPLTLQDPPAEPGTGAGLVAVVEGLERRMIRDALDRAEGVQTRAAELLGISERVLRYKLKKYGLGGTG